MKRYGAKKATEYRREEVDALVQKFVIGKALAGKLYEFANYYGYDDNGCAAKAEMVFNSIMSAEENAQAVIESFEKTYLEGEDNSRYEYVPYQPKASFKQISYLQSLIKKAGGHYDESIYDLTKEEASAMIQQMLNA